MHESFFGKWLSRLRDFFRPKRKKKILRDDYLRKIYVGNLNYSTTEEDIRGLLDKYGTIRSVEIIKHRSGRPKGFAFVEMSTADEVDQAIRLDGIQLMGRNIRISKAKPPKEGNFKTRRKFIRRRKPQKPFRHPR